MRIRTILLTVLAVGTLVPVLVFATPPAGVVTNVVLGQGAAREPLKEHIRMGNTWSVRLDGEGESELFVQDFVMGPGGYTGWHSHPGLVLIAVKEGVVEFYDRACAKRRYEAGQAFTEAAEPHTAINPGSANTRLLIAYVLKKGEPRRREESQPTCAATLGLL